MVPDNGDKNNEQVCPPNSHKNECVTIQIGNCGNRIGNQYWKMICEEHGIDFSGNFLGDNDDQLIFINSSFYESLTGRFIPRCVLTDLEYNTLDEIQNMDICALHSPENFVFGDDVGTSNNYAKGFYTNGSRLVDVVLEAVRHRAEECDNLCMLQFMHNISGGTGSGFSCLISNCLIDYLSKPFMVNYTVFPSEVGSDVNHLYNTALAFNTLMYDSSAVVSFSNTSICNVMEKIKYRPGQTIDRTETWDNVNRLIGQAICGITAPGRLPGQVPSSLEVIFTNVTPVPSLHFYEPTIGPCCTAVNTPFRKFDLVDIMSDIFNPEFSLGWANGNRKINDPPTKILCGAILYRGHLPVPKIEQTLYEYQLLHHDLFVSWLPNALFTNVVRIPPVDLCMTGTALFNILCTQRLINELAENFHENFKRGSNLNWYFSEGMEMEEFEDTYNNMKNFIKAYDQVSEKIQPAE